MEIIVNGGPQNDHGTEEFMASLVSLPAIVPLLQSFLVERSVPCQSMMDFSGNILGIIGFKQQE